MSTVWRRVPAVLGILFLLTVMPTVLVLCTRWFDWPAVTWPPLHSGFLGAFEPADVRAWAVATYHEIRLSLGMDGLLLASCLLALWGTWLVMICWLVTDTVALLRFGVRRLCANGPDGVRGWITALVTSTVLVSTASPSLAAAVPANPVAASAPRHPSGPHHAPLPAAPEADGPGPGPSASGPMLRTHRGDSLWELAKIHLGDGTRWREITDLNPHLSPEPQFLRAGDWLRLPDDAVHTEPAPLPDGARWIIVADGDTLSSLAQQHLGDPDRWHEIFELNRGRTQDADRTLRRPGFLMPGWRLAVPPTGTNDSDAAHLRPSTGEPVSLPLLAPEPVTAAPQRPTTSPQPSAHGRIKHVDVGVSAGVVAGVSTAGALGAVALVHYQFRRRRPHRRTKAEPLPTIYPLPLAQHRLATNMSADADDEANTDVDEDEADWSPGKGHRPAASTISTPASAAHREPAGEHSTAPAPEQPAQAASTPTAASGGQPVAGGGLEIARTTPGTSEATGEPGAVPLETAIGDGQRLRITIFGPPCLHYVPQDGAALREVTDALQPRMRELLVFLALHPGGVSRDEFMDALWGEAPTSNAFNTALSRLRRTLEKIDPELTDLVQAAPGRYRLDPDLASVDYWHFTSALAARRTAHTDADRHVADEQIVASYHGSIAPGMEAAWVEPLREHARRGFLDAVASCARAWHQHDPERTLSLLENARDLDPLHEPLYRDIMRLQSLLGHRESVPRTMRLLESRLAEIGTRPTTGTRELGARLAH
ncbi:LysM peptidoglycan-binding domain-containing protein [Saccharopolyspora sp. HNM0986]|uniref:LysM peptidoglycan-binding domain-containing protein n=1 Tax=Saccharopolyspora galaxeae TaxID=2781241 RepID=UPI00190A3681|nr:LysM peptidoglycan-binding domain-containing protein [Saccharopolyspora sp. HNM0986]MBK0870218.1 LysM peptidoglycan-binding domain-containing protein [Saccharopolyspora sp. HNM0986]